MSSLMAVVSVSASVSVLPVSLGSSVTAGDTTLRAVLAIALAVLALVAIDRMKPAAPRRPIPVRIDERAAPLWREPGKNERLRAAGNLGVGSLVAGAVLACALGFLLAITLEVIGGLLRQ